ncbi:MAG: hypothetical protein ACQESB_04130 [Elusimicrobiota bacterium]
MSKKSKKILSKKKLGEILKSLDFIDNAKLEEVLRTQKESDMRIGEVLSSMGYVDREVVLSLVGKQMGIPFVKVSEYKSIPQEILNYIPLNVARKNILIPFDRKEDILKIAMAEPQVKEIRHAISVLTGMKISPHISSEEEIKKAIELNYSS